MQQCYPAIKPNHHFYLKRDHHELYVEQSGNPNGIPVLFLHGGPGAGASADDRRFFNPEQYHIIIFDQRGAGRSRPHADLEANTTEHLIGDIEAIRHELGIEKWLLFGGSWGSTLSLLYAQAHPDAVIAMILRGIFLCRQQDLHWFYQSGASMIFPDYWEDYIKPIAPGARNDMIRAYYQLLTSSNEIEQMNAAKHWSLWEAQCATLRPNSEVVEHFSDPRVATPLARIEAHYFINRMFMPENAIIENMAKIDHIPGVIIHGRYDMVCPLDNAVELHRHWSSSELHIIREAGHSSKEPSILDALIKATDEFANRNDTA